MTRSGRRGFSTCRLRPGNRRRSRCRRKPTRPRDPASLMPGSEAQKNPVAVVQGVTHRYGKTLALDGISLEVPSGLMVGVIGPDGVGKSTLLGLLAGSKKLQSGTMRVLEGDIADRKHRHDVCPRIAYMPQGLGKNLYFELSVHDNVDFMAQLFGLS